MLPYPKLTSFLFRMFDYLSNELNFTSKVDEKNVAGMFRHGIVKLVLRALSDVSDQLFSGR